MQQTGNDRLPVQFQFGQDNGDTNRMNNIGFPGLPLLVLMGFKSHIVGPAHHLYIFIAVQALHRLHQLLTEFIGSRKTLGIADIFFYTVYFCFTVLLHWQPLQINYFLTLIHSKCICKPYFLCPQV